MSIDRLLSWFPNVWRARYEAEVRELLEAQAFTWRESGLTTLDSALRPTWLPTIGWVAGFARLIVVDGRRAGLAERLWMGIVALMRHAPWLQLFGEHRPARTTVLGLR